MWKATNHMQNKRENDFVRYKQAHNVKKVFLRVIKGKNDVKQRIVLRISWLSIHSSIKFQIAIKM